MMRNSRPLSIHDRSPLVRRPLLVLFTLVVIAALAGAPQPARARTADTIAVTTTDDEYGAGSDCSLREAIQAANDNAAFGGCPAGGTNPVIVLPVGTYTLTETGSGDDANATGDLDITGNLTISGAGRATTTIDANGLDRVLDILAGTVVINDVTIKGGQAPHGSDGGNGVGPGASGAAGGSGAHGGGIRNAGTLTLSHCSITGNNAGNGGRGGNGQDGWPRTTPGQIGGPGGHGGNGGEGGSGGGIYSSGALVLNACSVDGNLAGAGGSGGDGGRGGKGADGGSGTPTGANGGRGGDGGDAGPGGRGGAIDANGAALTLTDTVLTNNQSGAGGQGGVPGQGGNGGDGHDADDGPDGGKGGMGGLGGIGGNGAAGGDGGGLYGYGSQEVNGCTLAHNQTGDGGQGHQGGQGGLGGTGGDASDASVEAGDGGRGGDGGAGGEAGVGGKGGGILAWSTLTMTLTTLTSNETGAGGDGGGGGQAGNGGEGGNATYAGNGGVGGLGGLGSPGGNGGDGAGVVSYLDADEELTISQCSFQENATGSGGAGGHGGSGGDGGVEGGAGGTSLNPGLPGVNGHGKDGGEGGRGGQGGGLFVDPGGPASVEASTFYANLTGAGGQGGDGGDSGANLDNDKGNGGDGAHGSSGGFGGAILVDNHPTPVPLILENDTIHDNHTGAGGDGGDAGSGQENDGTAGDGGDGGSGGGIANNEQAILVSLTVTGNAASITTGDGGTPGGAAGSYGHGGGVWNQGSLNLGHTILAMNTAGPGPDCYGTFDSLDYNLIGAGGYWCTLVGSTDHIISGAAGVGPLADWGGPTQTRLLQPNSSALDAGADNCRDAADQPQTVDQRGYTRPEDGNGDGNIPCDIGAVEMQGFHTLSVVVVGSLDSVVRGDPTSLTCYGTQAGCQESLEATSAVTLTAQAGLDVSFLGWDGDCGGTEPTCLLTMDANKSVTATFGLPLEQVWVFLPLIQKDQ